MGRATPLYHAQRLSEIVGGAQIYLKREDLNHTGAHKINNAIGQALLAKKMGKKRLIAETGAGQHGVATATIAAKLGMECVVYMGAEDIKRQAMNVYRMKLLGATVVPVKAGSQTLKDALNEALRDWVTHVDATFYIIGTVAARILTLKWFEISSPLLVKKQRGNSLRKRDSCPMHWLLVLVAVPMQ